MTAARLGKSKSLLALVLAIAYPACGGEEPAPAVRSHAGSGPTAGAAGANATGGQAGRGGRGGSGGAAGTGRSDAGEGGTVSGGSSSGGGASGSGAGAGAAPSCLPLEEVPVPVQTMLDAAPACTGATPCGGELDGTSFAYFDVCVDEDAVFAETYAECPGSVLNGIGDRSLTGTLSFEDGVATHQATIKGTGVFQIPVECHACNCKDFQEVTLYNQGVSAFCYEDCYPDNSCRCLIDFEIEVDESESYDTSGSTLTLGTRTFDYCASADGLSLAETGSSPRLPGTALLVPPSDLDSPEVCDGVDNDHDGTVDDDPVECGPGCNRQGVCADVVERCVGAWTCEYASTAREMGEETRCDGLDNDCDGEVDEGLTGCVEICDGLDNDNDGTIDNHLTDAACPTNRGVCTQGVDAVCDGANGWSCAYTASGYQTVETTCDGLDNDCNGMVDEGCGCSTGTSKIFVLRKGMTDAGIVRMNLDGSNPELIVPIPQLFVFDIAVDPVGEKLYFYDFGDEALKRTDLDGTGIEPVWTGKTQMFALEPGSPGLGFVENDTYSIRAFPLAASTSITTIIPTAAVVAFAIDPLNQHLYWSDHSGTFSNGIMRAGYDGSSPTGVFGSAIYYPAALAVDPVHRRLYYSDGLGTHSVGLDGEGDRLDLPVSGQNAAPVDVALDLAGGKMYASEEGSDTVRRANLDGTNVEPVLSGAAVEAAEAIALFICTE
jgi:hypothetical protein